METKAVYAAILIALAIVLRVFWGLVTVPPVTAAPEPLPTEGIVRLYAEPVDPRAIAPTLTTEQLQPIEQAPVVSAEDPAGGVMPMVTFPSKWYVCVNEGVKVYGGLQEREDWYLYSLPRDTEVMVRELGSDTSWAMIQPAHWVKFAQLCPAED